MSSVSAAVDGGSVLDDRTTKARIRDAAIECFAAKGAEGTTARKVAAAAGVSPGLVMHHYGSMDGLRLTCDEHVASTIRRHKEEALAAGPNLDVLAALQSVGSGPLMGYLLDQSPGAAGHQHVFWVVAGFALAGLAASLGFRSARATPQ